MTIKKLSIMDFNQLFSSLKPHTKKIIVTPALILVSLLLILILGTLGFLRALANPQVAQASTEQVCDVLTQVSDTSTQTAGWTAIDPVASPLNASLYSGSGFSGSDATETVIPPWVNPATDTDFSGSGALWVSSDASWPGGSGNTEGSATTSQWRLFQDSFTLPVGSVVASATIWYSADNAASVYLNGSASAFTTTGDVYGATPVDGPANYGDVFMASFVPAAGTNTLDFVVRNWSTESTANPTGVLYKAVVNYCVPAVLPGAIAAEDFGVVSYDTGLGMLKGYTAGFGLTDATFAGVQSVVIQLFNGATLLQTNTATAQVGIDITGTQISTPFDVSGTFDYATDGYWVNVKESQYGQSVPATRVVATVTLANGKVVTAENTLLTGDPTTIYPTTTPSTITVTVVKFVQGMMATSGSANNADFPMTSTWDADNLGEGTGSYTLSDTNTVPYQAVTSPMTVGADYSTKEMVNGDVVGAQCATEKPFALKGYTTGNTLAEAASGTISMAQPEFTDLQTNKYVIVWNRDCSLPEGQIGGDVDGPNGILEVTSIDMIDTTAIANGTFTDGWEYVFHITAPMTEQNLAMKFSDWLRTGGGGTIPVANNMRISSAQANNGGATILLTAQNTYSSPALHMTGDLNAVMPGRQVEITVEVAVPNGTPLGAYTTNYGVQSSL